MGEIDGSPLPNAISRKGLTFIATLGIIHAPHFKEHCMTEPTLTPPAPIASQSPLTRVFQFLSARTRHFFQEHWESISVDLNTFPPLLRALVRVGYASVFLLLLATLFHEFWGRALPQVTSGFDALGVAGNFEGQIPISVLWISTIAYVIGWSFLFTGVTGTKRRFFLPVWAFYLLTWVNTQPEPGELASNLCCGGFVITLLLGLVYTLSAKHPFWRQYSLLEFGGWFLLVSFQMGLFLLGNSTAEVASNLDQIFTGQTSLLLGIPFGAIGLFYVTIPFWILLGVDATNGVADMSHALVDGGREGVPDRYWQWFTLPILVGLTVFLFLLNYFISVFFTFFLVYPLLILIALVLMLVRRWTPRAALIILWLGIATAIYHVLLGSALYGTDLTTVLYDALLPPAFLFMLFLFLDVLTFGKRFAQEDSPNFPRSARLLMYFGAALLFGATTLFRLNARLPDGSTDPSFINLANNFVFVAFLFVGPLVLLWNTWRNRADLFADAG
jgi:hypothetical protein